MSLGKCVPKSKLFKIIKEMKTDFKLTLIKEDIDSEIEFRRQHDDMDSTSIKLSKNYERVLRYIYNDDLENANKFFTKYKEFGAKLSVDCLDPSQKHYYACVDVVKYTTDVYKTGDGMMKIFLDHLMTNVNNLDRHIKNFTSMNDCLNGRSKKFTFITTDDDHYTFIAI